MEDSKQTSGKYKERLLAFLYFLGVVFLSICFMALAFNDSGFIILMSAGAVAFVVMVIAHKKKDTIIKEYSEPQSNRYLPDESDTI